MTRLDQMFVIGPTTRNLKTRGSVITVNTGALLQKWWRHYIRTQSFDLEPLMFQCWFAPVIFFEGKAVSCLLLVKHHDQMCRLPYQNPSGYPAVLSSCELFATSRQFLTYIERLEQVHPKQRNRPNFSLFWRNSLQTVCSIFRDFMTLRCVKCYYLFEIKKYVVREPF